MREEKVLTDAALCYLIKEGNVLLAMKVDKIGKDCWNGFGGGIKKGETPEECAVRELEEEAEVATAVESLEKAAIVDFYNTKSDGKTFVCKVHVFLVREWTGEPRETKEMLSPTWFDFDNLPFSEMMPADRVWLPLVLSGRKIMAEAHYGPFQKTLLGGVTIQETKNFSNIMEEVAESHEKIEKEKEKL